MPKDVIHTFAFKRSKDKKQFYKCVYNAKDWTFRRGLLSRVLKIAKDVGYGDIQVVDNRSDTTPVKHKFIASGLKAFQFQHDAANAALDNDIGIIVSPTGTGKTIIASLIIDKICRKTIVIVTDVVLLDQMQQSLQKWFDQPIGMIGDGEFDLQDITVTTIQSLYAAWTGKTVRSVAHMANLKEHLNDVGLVITDEAHLFDSNSVAEVMQLFTNAKKVIGVSATPYGYGEASELKENLELEQHLGVIIHDTRKIDFIDIGLKAPLIVKCLYKYPINKEYNKFTKKIYGKEEIDFSKGHRECLRIEMLENDDYKLMVLGSVLNNISEGKSSFIYAAHSIEYGESITNLIPGAVYICGATPRLERRKYYDALRKKELLTIVSDVGSTGLDLPNLDTMIIATDAKDIRQIKGRVERAAPGKQHGKIVDIHVDCMFLSKHHRIRKNQYRQAGHAIDNIGYPEFDDL